MGLNMNEEQIEKRIKELQKDNKYCFKLTEEVIDLIYRTAINDLLTVNENKNIYDLQKENKELNLSIKSLTKQYKNIKEELDKYKDIVENDSTNKLKIGILNPRKRAFIDILNYIERNYDIDIVYAYVKDQARK